MRNKLIAGLVTLGVAAAVLALIKYGPAAGTAGERGLVLYLPMATDLRDHSRFGRAVTVTGAVRLENGVALFPGDGGWLSLEHVPLDNRPFAISMWIKPIGPPFNQALFDQKDQPSENRHLHLALTSARPYFGFYANDSRGRRSVRFNSWNHLVFVFTGQMQEVWLDGQPAGRSASKVYLGGAGETFIGRHIDYPYLGASDFQGWMCELRVYEGLFEPERIVALYRRGLAGK